MVTLDVAGTAKRYEILDDVVRTMSVRPIVGDSCLIFVMDMKLTSRSVGYRCSAIYAAASVDGQYLRTKAIVMPIIIMPAIGFPHSFWMGFPITQSAFGYPFGMALTITGAPFLGGERHHQPPPPSAAFATSHAALNSPTVKRKKSVRLAPGHTQSTCVPSGRARSW